MGFMDELKKLTQPYDDEEDFFPGADESYKPKPKEPPAEKLKIGSAHKLFEKSFADDTPLPAEDPTDKPLQSEAAGGGFFGGLGGKKQPKPRGGFRERTMNLGGKDTSVILFSPKNFDEAGELVNYMMQNLTVVMTLEGVNGEMARRLLDFLSGIAFALQGKITPVSAKTYFITPQNVDILGAQSEQTDSVGAYF